MTRGALPPMIGLIIAAASLRAADPYGSDSPVAAGDLRRGSPPTATAAAAAAPAPSSSPLYEEESAPAKPRTPVAAPAPAPQETPAVPEAEAPPPPEKPVTMGDLIAAGKFGEVAADAETRKDGPLALALAWAYYRQNDFPNARVWFLKSAEWGGSGRELVLGRALTAFGDGNPDEALRLALPIADKERRAGQLCSDIAAEKAARAHEAGSPKESVRLLLLAYRFRYLTREEQLLLGWSYLKSGDTAKADATFEGLYRAYRDKESADGLLALHGAAKPGKEHLRELAVELGGPLRDSPLLADAGVSAGSQANSAGRHLAAVAASPELGAKTPGVAGPVVYAGGSILARSGRSGLEASTATSLPTGGARVVLFDRHELEVRASDLRLRTGTPAGTDPVGSAPVLVANIPPPPFPFAPTERVSGADLLAAYRYHGDDLSPYAVFRLPPDGPVAAEPNLRAGIDWFGPSSKFGVEGHYESATDSVLSWTGLRDPWTGAKWGRVMKTGGSLGGRMDIEDGYSASCSVSGESLTGKHVPSNTAFGAVVGLRKNLEYEGFSYLAVGPDISFVSYDRNLGKFTYGQGGYFSPQSLIRLGVGANLLTTEGKFWLAKIDAGAGWQTNRQDGTPYFPLAPDGRNHAGENASSVVLGLRCEAGALLTPHWMLGGFFDVNKAPNFDSFGLGLFLSWHFERRSGLYREDLAIPLR